MSDAPPLDKIIVDGKEYELLREYAIKLAERKLIQKHSDFGIIMNRWRLVPGVTMEDVEVELALIMDAKW